MKGLPLSSYCPSVVIWDYPTKSLKADVLFGSPGKDCRGVGICRVGYRGTFQEESNNCKAAVAEISFTKDERLQLKFKVNDLCQRIQKIHFRHGYFKVEKDFWMPDFVNKALWLKSGYTIKKGKYKVEISAEYFTIKF